MVSKRSLGRFIGLVIAVVMAAALYRSCDSMRTYARRVSGANDLTELFQFVVHHARMHEGLFPPLDSEPGRLMIERNVMFEEFGVTGRTVTMEYDDNAPYTWRDYEEEPALLKDRNLIDDHSWWYLGYAVKNEQEGRAFLRGYLRHVANGLSFQSNLDTGRLDKDGNPLLLKRLAHPYLAKWTKGDSPGADIDITPVFIERPGFWKNQPGGWVLFLDGHTEFIEYPGRFPMTEEFVRTLILLDELGDLLNESNRSSPSD